MEKNEVKQMDRTKAAEILHKAKVCYATEYLDCHMVCDMCKYHVEDSLVVEAIDTAIKALDKDIDVPIKWIPVSEKLPEEPFGCLVTVWDEQPMTGEMFENLLPYFVGWDGEQWNDGDGMQCPFEIIAWMPLPAPWKGEGE